MKCPETNWTKVHRHRSVVNNFSGNIMVSRRLAYLPLTLKPLVQAGTSGRLMLPFLAIRVSLREQARGKTTEVLGEGYQ